MSAAAARPLVAAHRRAMIAKVHLGAKDLGLDEDARRDVLQRVTGHRSSADCTDDQLDAVLAEFKRLGWKSTTPGGKAGAAKHPVALKARAMWISLWNLGAIRNGSEKALEAFAARQLGVDRLQWADQAKGKSLLEALKKMAEREGWSQDLRLVRPDKHAWSLKARVVQRQAEILGREPMKLHEMTEAQLDRLAAELGPEVRKARAPADA